MLLRPLCRSSCQAAPRKVAKQQKRLYAAAGHDDKHGHGHGDKGHGHDGHAHGDGHGHDHVVPLKLQDWVPTHLQQKAVQTVEAGAPTTSALASLKESGALDHFAETYKSIHDPAEGPDWISQITNSKTVLECLAQIHTSELSFDIGKVKPAELVAKYKEELAQFESVTVPKLQKEGISPRVISHLQSVYTTRARIHPAEVDRVLSSFRILMARDPNLKNFRATTGTRTVFWSRRFLLTRLGIQEMTKIPVTQEDRMARNLNHFKGWKALSDAFARGLTDEEYAHVTSVLKEGAFSTEVLNTLNTEAGELKFLMDTDRPKAEALMKSLLAKYPNATKEREYILTKLKSADEYQTPGGHVTKGGAKSHTPLESPYATSVTETPLTAEALGAAIDKGLAAEAGNARNTTILQQVKAAFNSIFTKQNSRDIEVFGLLRSADLDQEKLDKLYSFFTKTPSFSSEISDKLLQDVLHPNPIAAKLWGDILMLNSYDTVEYKRKFHDLPGSYTTEFNSPEVQKDYATYAQHTFLPDMAPFVSGYDELYHAKMLRLANEFYNFNTSSDVGVIQFDLFQHAYDISPGEDTLERVHPFPMPEHTYEELPIIKFDGYEESDDPEIHKLSQGSGHH